jgi:Ca2+:H+ antiporter
MMKNIFKPSLYWLFIFAPVAILLEKAGAKDSLVFFASALAIIPIAKLIGESTENLAHHTGDAIGGLLNATFGNLPELIIAVIALQAGLYDMVRASIIGAILANLLLATGLSFFAGGLKYHSQEYNPASTRIYNSMMFIAICSLIIPAAFGRAFGGETAYAESQRSLNISLAISLLAAYILYLFFMIRTHPDLFKSVAHDEESPEGKQPWSVGRAVGTLVGASLGAAFMSEILVGAAEGTGKELGLSTAFIGIVFISIVGGAAESISAITMAAKNKLDLTMGIAMGSSIQIALFVAPLLVVIGLFTGQGGFYLTFSRVETATVLMAVLLMAVISGDGHSNWYKGVQLVTLYVLIALLFYFIPDMG